MPRKQRRRSTRARNGSTVSRSRSSVSTVEAGDGFVDGADVGAVGLLERSERPSLRLQPGGVTFGPRLFGEREAAAVPEEEFREAVSGAQQIDGDVFATTEQIARGFFLLGRNVDGGERTRAVEDGELGGIAAIGFDAVTGATRNQGGRDDIARHAVRGEGALQFKATGACFVAALDGCAAAPQAVDEATNRRSVGAERM